MKKCPHCQHEVFKGFIKKGAVLQFNDEGEASIQKEFVAFEVEKDQLQCVSCKKIFTYDELTSKVACVSCKKLYEQEELDEHGVCALCEVKEKFREASLEDLYKVILDLQRQIGPQGQKIEHKIVKAEETVKVMEEKQGAKAEKARAQIDDEIEAIVPLKETEARMATAEEKEEIENLLTALDEAFPDNEEPEPVEDVFDGEQMEMEVPGMEPEEVAIEEVPKKKSTRPVIQDMENIFAVAEQEIAKEDEEDMVPLVMPEADFTF